MTGANHHPITPLVAVDDLARNLRSPGCVVVDCRFELTRPDAGEAAYLVSHVPGAVYAHLDRDLAAPRGAGTGRHPLPDPGGLAHRFSEWGIGPGIRVVAYDDAGGAIAARLWWLLRWMGHGAVALLDGGWPAWAAAGLPVESGAGAGRPASFEGNPGQMPVIDAAEIEKKLADPAFVLLDARAAPRYAGRAEPIDAVAGHVPGALNLPFTEFLGPGGVFLDSTSLASRFRAAIGERAPADVAVMCGSGVTACHEIFAMELAGLAGARLYPGSWSEWIVDPRRPVARE